MIIFDIQSFTAKLAAIRDSKGPTPEPQQHEVTLLPPESESEHEQRWDLAQTWCRDHVRHEQGQLWSRHRERDGSLVFSFSDLGTGALFALTFRGV